MEETDLLHPAENVLNGQGEVRLKEQHCMGN